MYQAWQWGGASAAAPNAAGFVQPPAAGQVPPTQWPAGYNQYATMTPEMQQQWAAWQQYAAYGSTVPVGQVPTTTAFTAGYPDYQASKTTQPQTVPQSTVENSTNSTVEKPKIAGEEPKDATESKKLKELEEKAQQWKSSQQPTTAPAATWSFPTTAPAPPPATSNPATATTTITQSSTQSQFDKEEEEFEQQFKEWEKQFETWKDQNKNHPDKQAFAEYEKQWQEWRETLIQKKEQMQKAKAERLAASAAASTAVVPPSSAMITAVNSAAGTTNMIDTTVTAPNAGMYFPPNQYMYMQPYMYPGGVPVPPPTMAVPPAIPPQFPPYGPPPGAPPFGNPSLAPPMAPPAPDPSMAPPPPMGMDNANMSNHIERNKLPEDGRIVENKLEESNHIERNQLPEAWMIAANKLEEFTKDCPNKQKSVQMDLTPLLEKGIESAKELKKEYQEKERNMEEKMEKLREDLHDKNKTIEELMTRMSSMDDKKKNAELNEELKKLKEDCRDKDKNIKELKAGMKIMHASKMAMQDTINEMITRLKDAEELYRKLYVEKEKLAKKLKKVMSKITSSAVSSNASTTDKSESCFLPLNVDMLKASTSTNSDSDTGEHMRAMVNPVKGDASNFGEVKVTYAGCLFNTDFSKEPVTTRKIYDYPISISNASAEVINFVNEGVSCELCNTILPHAELSEHYNIVHKRTLCPVCGQLFDITLPPRFLTIHVNEHFNN